MELVQFMANAVMSPGTPETVSPAHQGVGYMQFGYYCDCSYRQSRAERSTPCPVPARLWQDSPLSLLYRSAGRPVEAMATWQVRWTHPSCNNNQMSVNTVLIALNWLFHCSEPTGESKEWPRRTSHLWWGQQCHSYPNSQLPTELGLCEGERYTIRTCISTMAIYIGLHSYWHTIPCPFQGILSTLLSGVLTVWIVAVISSATNSAPRTPLQCSRTKVWLHLYINSSLLV